MAVPGAKVMTRAKAERRVNPLCTSCGMPCPPNEYHPYAACLMFRTCNDENTVRSNLQAVVDHGAALTRAKRGKR